jgi:hypothetical protein
VCLSAEFARLYYDMYNREAVPYQGTAQFAAAAALADAIERAGTLDTHAVAAQLRAQDLSEFYAR